MMVRAAIILLGTVLMAPGQQPAKKSLPSTGGKIPANSASAPVTAAVTDLTPCEELYLLERYQEYIAACQKVKRTDLWTAEAVVESVKGSLDRVCTPLALPAGVPNGGCAEFLYILGEHEKALGKLVDNYQVSHAEDHFIRGRVKFALSDTSGALAEFETGFAKAKKETDQYLVLAKTQEDRDKIIFVFNGKLMKVRLYHAVILFRMGRYNDALESFNDYAGVLLANTSIDSATFRVGTAGKLGDVIRKAAGGRLESSTGTQSAIDIKHEIEDAERSGRTAPLPLGSPCQPDRSLPAGMTRYEVRNSTAYDLRVVLSGPTEREIRVLPNASNSVMIPGGSYKVLAKLSSPSVLPFVGQRVFSAASGCAVDFYINRRP